MTYPHEEVIVTSQQWCKHATYHIILTGRTTSFFSSGEGHDSAQYDGTLISRGLRIGLSSVLPTQYRLCGRRFLQVKRPNQQYQSTEGTNSTQKNQTYNKQTWTQNTASRLVYSNMGWLGDGSHRGQGCQAWSAVGLPPRYPLMAFYFP